MSGSCYGTLREAAQALADAVGSHDNQNMPWGLVRAARERLLTVLLTSRSEKPATEWRPMETAPRDGTLVFLLIYPDEERCCPLEDTEKGSRTVGHNNFEHDGDDRWLFAGWSWEQDHYTQGDGNPAGWMPIPEAK